MALSFLSAFCSLFFLATDASLRLCESDVLAFLAMTYEGQNLYTLPAVVRKVGGCAVRRGSGMTASFSEAYENAVKYFVGEMVCMALTWPWLLQSAYKAPSALKLCCMEWNSRTA